MCVHLQDLVPRFAVVILGMRSAATARAALLSTTVQRLTVGVRSTACILVLARVHARAMSGTRLAATARAAQPSTTAHRLTEAAIRRARTVDLAPTRAHAIAGTR